MNIKEAYDVIYEHLKEECDKHSNCKTCFYKNNCEELFDTSYYLIGGFRRNYLKHLYDVNNSVKEDKSLINNPCFNRVYANKGDKVLCIDNGGSYTTYKDFFKQNGREDLLDKYKGWPLTVGRVYGVIDIYPHTDRTCNVYILKETYDDTVVYLCTDDTDYLKRLTDKCKWTGKSKQRVTDILFEVGHLDEYNFTFVEGGYLLLTYSNTFGYNTKLIPNVPKMSSKEIKKKISSYIKYIGGYVC